MDVRLILVVSIVGFAIVTAVRGNELLDQNDKPALQRQWKREAISLHSDDYVDKRGRGMRYRRCINPRTGERCRCDLYRKGPQYIHCRK